MPDMPPIAEEPAYASRSGRGRRPAVLTHRKIPGPVPSRPEEDRAAREKQMPPTTCAVFRREYPAQVVAYQEPPSERPRTASGHPPTPGTGKILLPEPGRPEPGRPFPYPDRPGRHVSITSPTTPPPSSGPRTHPCSADRTAAQLPPPGTTLPPKNDSSLPHGCGRDEFLISGRSRRPGTFRPVRHSGPGSRRTYFLAAGASALAVESAGAGST